MILSGYSGTNGKVCTARATTMVIATVWTGRKAFAIANYHYGCHEWQSAEAGGIFIRPRPKERRQLPERWQRR